jgi:DNA-binding XRE family transcriptional regulator
MSLNRKYISPLTVDDLIRERDAKSPGFAARVDARVAELALARKLRALREKRGLTQAELAAKAGTGQAAIARIEAGKATPKLDLLGRIAGALGARLKVTLTAERA